MRTRWHLAFGLTVVLTLFGCTGGSDEEGAAADPIGAGGKADGATGFKLRITLHSDGDWTLREQDGSTLPGAPDPLTDFACAPLFARGDVQRVECTRGAASVEALYRPAARESVVIFRPAGRTSDRRSYATCSTRSPRQPLPTTLNCTWVGVTQSGGLQSPVPPTASGIDIPNAHWVGAGLLRSMAPRSDADYQALQAAGVQAVLIFKKPTGNGSDVANEITALRALGLEDEAVLNVPFAWKDFPDFATPCRQTLEGLRFLKAQREVARPTLLHCTVGEDRTGFLAGLYRLLEGEADVQAVFADEMCERGFGSGNPFKPVAVTGKVDAGLIPLYRKLAFKVLAGELTWDLEESACATEPTDAQLATLAELDPGAYACGTFTSFEP